MAVQAHFYPENHGFLPMGGGVSPDCAFDYARGAGLSQAECFGDGSVVCFSKAPRRAEDDGGSRRMAAFSQCLTAHVEKQRQEVDHYIRLQNESLRLALREQGKQQIATLVKKIESRTAVMLRRKEEEIAQAANKTMELEIFLGKLETENQLWQRIAQENEAMAMSLNNTLDQMRERVSNCFDYGSAAAVADDAESCCDMNREEEEEEEPEAPAGNRAYSVSQQEKKMICRGCNRRNSTVIFLPCRHLCSCKDCEPMLDSCPVCTTAKKASIEALIF